MIRFFLSLLCFSAASLLAAPKAQNLLGTWCGPCFQGGNPVSESYITSWTFLPSNRFRYDTFIYSDDDCNTVSQSTETEFGSYVVGNEIPSVPVNIFAIDLTP